MCDRLQAFSVAWCPAPVADIRSLGCRPTWCDGCRQRQFRRRTTATRACLQCRTATPSVFITVLSPQRQLLQYMTWKAWNWKHYVSGWSVCLCVYVFTVPFSNAFSHHNCQILQHQIHGSLHDWPGCLHGDLSVPNSLQKHFWGVVCLSVCLCVCVRACLQSHSANPPLFVTVSSPWQHLLHYKLAACLETWISQGNRQMAGKCRGKLFLAYWDILSIL